MLAQKIQDDLITSLKAKDSARVEVLRLVRSELKNAEIDNGAPLSDEQVLAVLTKYVKKLREAADMFDKGGRTDLAEENRAQESIVAEYLPAQMGDDELRAGIEALAAENKELFASNRNALIGIAMKKYSSVADPQKIMQIVQSL